VIEIQQLPNILLENSNYGIGDLDDGIIHIGTNFCKNHDIPLCNNCPIKDLCEGFLNKKELLDEYRT
jgi:adenine-specific DNA glycosylase